MMTILKGGGLTVRQTASIELFLRQLKLFVEKNSIIIVKREASVQFLASRGVSARGLEEIILNLTTADCFDGPEPDRDPRYADKWTVAEFAPLFLGERLYLKVSIRTDVERAKCLSVKAYMERRGSDE